MSSPSKRILAVDQSTTTLGWAIFDQGTDDFGYGFRGRLVAHGAVVAKSPRNLERNKALEARLAVIKADLLELMAEFRPTLLVMEDNQYIVQKHVAAKNAMSRVEGLMYHLAGYHLMEVETVNPSTVKKRVTGYGKAEKADVIEAVARWTQQPPIKDHNEADAIAIGLAYLMAD